MEFEHAGWLLEESDYEDGDGFHTPDYTAVRGGERRGLNVSRFFFTPTPARFAFLVDTGFPAHPPRAPGRPYGPWNNEDLDRAIAAAKIGA